MERGRAAGGIGKGRYLRFEVAALDQFHLDRMHACFRPAIVTGGPAALEAAVHDVAVCG